TAQTINDTPVRDLLLIDGSPADPALALQLLPTGAATSNNGAVGAQFPDVLQVFTEAEAASIGRPPLVTSGFPYGFIVRKPSVPTTRALPASPAATQFDGEVTFGFAIPVQAPGSDPETITVMMLALDDSETRVTQSLEEQDVVATAKVEQRARDLGATT